MTKKQIVVLQRGWVVVGDVTKSGEEFVIDNASVIRTWGTRRGLGELRHGPLSNTVLDPAGTITTHELTVVFRLDVDGDGWSK